MQGPRIEAVLDLLDDEEGWRVGMSQARQQRQDPQGACGEEPAGDLEALLRHLEEDQPLDLLGEGRLNILRVGQHVPEFLQEIVERVEARLAKGPEILT